jgi:hypothetical protein
MKCAVYVVHIGEDKWLPSFKWGLLRERHQFEDLGVTGKTILNKY